MRGYVIGGLYAAVVGLAGYLDGRDDPSLILGALGFLSFVAVLATAPKTADTPPSRLNHVLLLGSVLGLGGTLLWLAGAALAQGNALAGLAMLVLWGFVMGREVARGIDRVIGLFSTPST